MGTEDKIIIRKIKTHEEIVSAIKGVAKKLNDKFVKKDEEVVLIPIMKGGLPFAMELMKHLDFDLSMDFVKSSSYYLYGKSGETKTSYAATVPIKGKNVIIADDLVDSGHTMQKITQILEAYKPKSITIAAMYGKEERIQSDYEEIYCWEKNPPGFLLGFGLDYDEKYRNLPYIAIIKEED